MDISAKQSVSDQLLEDNDAMLSEYDALISEIKEIKKRALKLYVQVKKEEEDRGVAKTLEHILQIPE